MCMTREEREFSRLIAKEVMEWSEKQMGYQWVWLTGGTYDRGDGYQIPCHIDQRDWNPLYNYNHTMLVVKRIKELGWITEISNIVSWNNYEEDEWTVTLTKYRQRNQRFASHKILGYAVCVAALRAV